MKSQSIVSVAKLLTFAAAASFGLLSSSPAYAGSASTSMAVSALVSNNCSISAAALSFGAYDPNSASALDGSSNLTVQCTLGASANIQLGQGSNPDGASSDAAPLRRLSDGTNFLSYALFQDGAYTTAWGNTGGTGLAHTGTGTSQSVSVYGRIAISQNVPAGTYSDSVTATINF